MNEKKMKELNVVEVNKVSGGKHCWITADHQIFCKYKFPLKASSSPTSPSVPGFSARRV